MTLDEFIDSLPSGIVGWGATGTRIGGPRYEIRVYAGEQVSPVHEVLSGLPHQAEDAIEQALARYRGRQP